MARSAEWCANISKAKLAKKLTLSDDHKAALRAAHVGRRAPECKYGHDMTQVGSRNKYGACVECLHVYRRTYGQAYKQDNKSAIAAVNREKRYGVSVFDYAELMVKQDGKCALCGGGPRGKRVDLDVDHDHTTGKVRGLLCTPCNVFLGRVENNPELLDKIESYLKEHRDSSMVTK